MKKLFIVESPGKVSKISGILGSSYVVKSTLGHFRDLNPKNMSVDIDNKYEPLYIATKRNVEIELKEASKKASIVYIATDMDLEGHAIGYHVKSIIGSKPYKRVVFNEISKSAILSAINSGGTIDTNKVEAQKTRRVIDRLFGYTISPLLSKQIGGVLSAGRVQSVASRIIIDKEQSIKDFIELNSDSTYFRSIAMFDKMKSVLHEASNKPKTDAPYKGSIANIPYGKKKDPYLHARLFMESCLKSK